MMKILTACIFLVLSILLHSGHAIDSLSYDYSATTKCLEEPERAQYGGGILENPEFDNGKEGWTVYGEGEVEDRMSKNGNRFIVSLSRKHSTDSFSQKVQLEKGKIYAFSAWVQVSEGPETVTVLFRTSPGGMIIPGGHVKI